MAEPTHAGVQKRLTAAAARLNRNKTKLVCTIGPASVSPGILRRMLEAGMNIARLNFSHGELAWHGAVIGALREAAEATGRPVTILADLPGPKIRIGQLVQEPLELHQGDTLTLTAEDRPGGAHRIFVNFPRLPAVVKPGDNLYLSDGNLQLEVIGVASAEVACRVIVGGELRSRKGLNLPGIDLGIGAFTEHDQVCLKFALEHGADAVCQSFVETGADVAAVRQAAATLGYQPFIIAKMERAGALTHADEILTAADGIMIGRGDLGVETPIERIALVQKDLIRRANLRGKPVITATQMLESMVDHYLPTRAEATDVANAILDGTDAVMLSEESALGRFPVEAVRMLARIAAATEPHRTAGGEPVGSTRYDRRDDTCLVDLVSRSVRRIVADMAPAAVIVPSATRRAAQMVSRFKLPVWIAAVCTDAVTCHGLQFSYGVAPMQVAEYPVDWREFARQWVQREGWTEDLVVLMEGPGRDDPGANPRLELINLRSGQPDLVAAPTAGRPAEARRAAA